MNRSRGQPYDGNDGLTSGLLSTLRWRWLSC